jgi:hypothetical protein
MRITIGTIQIIHMIGFDDSPPKSKSGETISVKFKVAKTPLLLN